MDFFSETAQKRLLGRIIQCALLRVEAGHHHWVSVSDKAFFDAMQEANFDIRFLKERRNLESGISEGKIAGILYFRLTRAQFINPSAEILDIGEYRTLQ